MYMLIYCPVNYKPQKKTIKSVSKNLHIVRVQREVGCLFTDYQNNNEENYSMRSQVI
jgi:hypothetical protein